MAFVHFFLSKLQQFVFGGSGRELVNNVFLIGLLMQSVGLSDFCAASFRSGLRFSFISWIDMGRGGSALLTRQRTGV